MTLNEAITNYRLASERQSKFTSENDVENNIKAIKEYLKLVNDAKSSAEQLLKFNVSNEIFEAAKTYIRVSENLIDLLKKRIKVQTESLPN